MRYIDVAQRIRYLCTICSTSIIWNKYLATLVLKFKINYHNHHYVSVKLQRKVHFPQPNCLAMATYNGWKFMVLQTINFCHWKLMVCAWGGGLR